MNEHPDQIIIAKAISKENTYFIFRNNSEEVTLSINDTGMIKSNHKLTHSEIQFLREEYPLFFNK
ncbi:hypothetical protein [Flavobacterium sp. GT3P67]|uniref:hypothetical protein n=1 Tax=Flavobacterium sp. GT3P67 TaxID=2541722 RepID=UPI001051BE69|nr:hypothetical protein [Flavobacterium sp. GT3P67]TDE53778.1 hypothetical protein E0H99_07110 [Flavobacterium sp. GT3P67]